MIGMEAMLALRCGPSCYGGLLAIEAPEIDSLLPDANRGAPLAHRAIPANAYPSAFVVGPQSAVLGIFAPGNYAKIGRAVVLAVLVNVINLGDRPFSVMQGKNDTMSTDRNA